MNLGLSILSGALLVLLFPRANLTFLAPVALTPLLIACAREASAKRRFLNGWASGIVFWFFLCSWIQFVLEVHGGMGRWGGWGTFVLFAILKGLYTGVFAALAGPLMRRASVPRVGAIPAVAALWVAVEYSHGTVGLAWLGLGFQWLHLGNAAIDWPLLPRLAPLMGVWGMSFVLAMLGAAVALAVLKRPRIEFAPLAIILALFVLPAVPAPETGVEQVHVVQPNIDTESRWTTESFAALTSRLATISLNTAAPLIVWPEAPAPFYPERPAFRGYLASIARATQAAFLMGGIAYNAGGAPLNSAFLVNSEGDIVARYDKIELVPFGEYVPSAFSWVNQISGEIGAYSPGENIVTFPLNGHTAGAFICYESAFPSLVRSFAAAGANVLMNLSNDGYFGETRAREQHLALVRMRAAENRRWIVRATNNGITAMIDPAGRITERLPEYRETGATMRFNYVTEQTLYTRWNDWFAWLCVAGAIAGLSANYAGSRAHRRP